MGGARLECAGDRVLRPPGRELRGRLATAPPRRGRARAGRAGSGLGSVTPGPAGRVGLGTVAVEWTRIGVTGFGGPPAHIALLRRLVVDREHWLDERELEDTIAACNLLPGPASTQLAIFCAGRVAGPLGAVLGGLAFVVPALVLVLALAALFLAHGPPAWVRGAGAGAGAVVAAVAVRAGLELVQA